MRLPTKWISLDRTETKITELDDMHLGFIVGMLEGIILRRGANPYKKFRKREFNYPHLGKEKIYLKAMLREKERRGI